jgi:hypothetical protein
MYEIREHVGFQTLGFKECVGKHKVIHNRHRRSCRQCRLAFAGFEIGGAFIAHISMFANSVTSSVGYHKQRSKTQRERDLLVAFFLRTGPENIGRGDAVCTFGFLDDDG